MYTPKTALEARICLWHASAYVVAITTDKVTQLAALALLREAIMDTYQYAYSSGQAA